MRTDKYRAAALRLQGHSYSEIQDRLGIPKSTLSGWFSKLVLSDKAQERIAKRSREGSFRGLLKKSKLQTHQAQQRAKQAKHEASRIIKTITERELLLIGAALYWGEGYKKPMVRNGRELTCHYIGLSNADPELVQIFIQFLEKVVKIPRKKIRASIRIYEHLNEEITLKYWQNITGIPLENFEKAYYGISKSSEHKRPYNRLPYGTIQVRVGDTEKFHHIMGLIDGIKSTL